MKKLAPFVKVVAAIIVVGLVIGFAFRFGRPLVSSLSGLLPDFGPAVPTVLWDVVPGKSVGPLKIGMTTVQVYNVLGSPDEVNYGMREVWSYGEVAIVFDNVGLMGVQMLRPGRIFWKGRLLDGNSTTKDVVDIFGPPDFMSFWTFDNNQRVRFILQGYSKFGLGVLTDAKTGRLAGLIITPPELQVSDEEPKPPAGNTH